jgi:hypothetical protein
LDHFVSRAGLIELPEWFSRSWAVRQQLAAAPL